MVYIRCNSSELSNWSKSFVLSNKEDVATLLSAYEKCLLVYKPEDICGVVEKGGYYACIIDDSVESGFDLFSWLSQRCDFLDAVEINCANARYLFPSKLSRGEYQEAAVEGTGEFSDPSDETATGCWDEDGPEIAAHYIRRLSTGEDILIEDEDGVIFGRSSTKAGYVVDTIDDLISRLHARVYLENGRYMVEDLGSKNGTFINNVKVFPGKDREIKVGNTLRLANEEFKFM